MPEPHALVLAGCTPEPLAAYLKALAVFRLVAEQADPQARGSWQEEGFCLTSALDRPGLQAFFLRQCVPTPVLAPWNAASGFWDRTSAGKALQRLRQSTNPRLAPLREAVAAADDVLAGAGVRELPKKAGKEDLLRLLRSRLPDAALDWLDAAVALAEEVRYAPILGSGGNDGRLDFTANLLQHLERVLSYVPQAPGTGRSRRGDFDEERARAWLGDALFAEGRPPHIAASAGQYHPGSVGGPNATRGMEGGSLVNPWDFILLVEGSLLFAGAVVRRWGNGMARAGFPFTVEEASPVGAGGLADSDSGKGRGELWVPLWRQPATYPEVRHLLAEGRAQLGRRQARSGVEFARAVAGLGVDRGIDSFCRYGLLQRNGKAYLAAPLGRIAVRERPHAHLIRDLDPWLLAWRRFCGRGEAAQRYRRALRDMEAAMFDYCTDGSPRSLQGVLAAVGRAERELHLAPAATGAPWPLHDLSTDWLRACDDGRPEFGLAAALASIQDATIGDLRVHLEPVAYTKGRYRWSGERPPVAWGGGSLSRDLAAVHRRRLLAARRAGGQAQACAGRRWAAWAHVQAFLDGAVDDGHLADLLWGLATLRWPRPAPETGGRSGATAASGRTGAILAAPPDLCRAYALLKLAFWPGPLQLHAALPGVSVPAEVSLLQRLQGGDLQAALRIASQALWARRLTPLGWTGGRGGVTEYAPAAGGTTRLAAALLIPVADPRPLAELVLQPLTPDIV